MTDNLLINTSDLKALIKENKVTIVAKSHRIINVNGWVLELYIDDVKKTLSTYLSGSPRLFKRSDALLKEAENMGLPYVISELNKK
jgi:hypothetical protein